MGKSLVSPIDPSIASIYREDVAQWWRLFIDKLTGRSKEIGVVGPRRRKSPRYPYQASISAKCSSWPKFVELFTGNVSAGGLFVPTDQVAQLGESIEIELALPSGEPLVFRGTVVNIISDEQAAHLGKNGGLGIKLEPPTGEAKERFDQIIATARAEFPAPAEVTHEFSESVDSESVDSESVDIDVEDPEESIASPAAVVDSPVVGIDLGTTYTSVAAIVGKKVTILPWPHGGKSTPSVVSFPSATECIVGPEARRRLTSDPSHTVNSPKRLLGRQYNDREIQGYIGQAPYRMLRGPDGSVVVDIWGSQYAITQLCSYLLNEARKVAEEHLGHSVHRCVMTIPVSFDEERAQIMRRAASLAHLEVVGFIDEPSAAALANRFDPHFGGVVGVYDFGGGTFDFSIVDVSGGDFHVLATAGDTWLGGDDFDVVLAEAAANQFWRVHKVDLRKQAVEWQKLLFACERAKRVLSVEREAAIFVPEVLRGPEGMIDLNISLDRETFERACRPVIDRSLATCQQALELLDMKKTDLTTIYLSGGTTYMPVVRQALSQYFQVPIRTGVPPEHSVCLGAAIHAAQVQLNAAKTLDER